MKNICGLFRIFVLTLVLTIVSACGSSEVENVELSVTPTPPVKQTPNPENTPKSDEDRTNRPSSEPYTGDLAIFEDESREKNLQIFRVMDELNIKEGARVADIGAGSGWFTTRAARRVGENGKVFAVEINEEYLKHITERAAKENLPNIETVRGAEENPNLSENSVDAVLILKTYHEIGQAVRVLKHLHKAMKNDAKLGIIDRGGKGDDHGIERETVIKEAERAGFRLEKDFDFVKPDGMDYFLVFVKK